MAFLMRTVEGWPFVHDVVVPLPSCGIRVVPQWFYEVLFAWCGKHTVLKTNLNWQAHLWGRSLGGLSKNRTGHSLGPWVLVTQLKKKFLSLAVGGAYRKHAVLFGLWAETPDTLSREATWKGDKDFHEFQQKIGLAGPSLLLDLPWTRILCTWERIPFSLGPPSMLHTTFLPSCAAHCWARLNTQLCLWLRSERSSRTWFPLDGNFHWWSR